MIKFDVITLTEIRDTIIDKYCNLLDKYAFFYVLPLKSRAEGVSMYVKESLSPVMLHNLTFNAISFECIWIELSVNKVKYMVHGYYRHPSTPVLQFKVSMMEILSTLRRN